MGIKGSRNAKKITNKDIQEAAAGFLNSMRWHIKVGSMMFTITHRSGVFSVHNENGDLLRKFTVSSPIEVESGAIKRHNWTKELTCSECNIDMFSIQNTNDECGGRPVEVKEVLMLEDEPVELLMDVPVGAKGVKDFLAQLKNF